LKISFITIGSDIQANGFRKMAALARLIHPDVEVSYILISNPYFYTNFFQQSGETDFRLSEIDLYTLGDHFSKSDMVCFSSMSVFANTTKQVIDKIRSLNPKTYIVWGGIHPILHSEDAIQSSDAICVGEGETAFKNFLSAYKKGSDFTKTGNFWFNLNGNIIRNNFLPLHDRDDLDKFPFPVYANRELVFKQGKGFFPLDLSKYLEYESLTYNTIWSVGCPYKCVYCGNSKFIENHSNYREIRYPSVDYIISEVKNALKKHPHISVVVFHDDSFMAIPVETLKEFADRWKNEIGLIFCVLGVIPGYVQEDKMALLVRAGMYRIRMGIQSGSNRILKFYKRPNKAGLINHSVSIINKFSRYMVPPGYDIIVDNPVENRKDVLDTLDMLYNLPRPYILNIFTLRIIPNTELAREFSKLGISHMGIDSEDYTSVAPNFANVMVFMLAVFRPPRWIYKFLSKYVKEYSKEQDKYHFTLHFFRLLMLAKMLISRIRFMEFPGLSGKVSFLVWKMGLIKFWQTRMKKKLSKILV